jgi:hypothetical protein
LEAGSRSEKGASGCRFQGIAQKHLTEIVFSYPKGFGSGFDGLFLFYPSTPLPLSHESSGAPQTHAKAAKNQAYAFCIGTLRLSDKSHKSPGASFEHE